MAIKEQIVDGPPEPLVIGEVTKGLRAIDYDDGGRGRLKALLQDLGHDGAKLVPALLLVHEEVTKVEKLDLSSKSASSP